MNRRTFIGMGLVLPILNKLTFASSNKMPQIEGDVVWLREYNGIKACVRKINPNLRTVFFEDMHSYGTSGKISWQIGENLFHLAITQDDKFSEMYPFHSIDAAIKDCEKRLQTGRYKLITISQANDIKLPSAAMERNDDY